jgi:tryptophanyl-tRNA synthetase
VLALGLDKKDVYIQSRMIPRYYEFTLELSKKITFNTFEAIYGQLDMGKVAANFLQYADILHGQLPEWDGPMPSITAIGIEQDPHLRATRDIAKRLPYRLEPPSSIYIVHQPGLTENMKMSSSIPASAIFLNDTPEVAKRKIMDAFSGGQATIAEHRKLGGNPEVDRAYQMLRFHHPDDKKVEKLHHDFKSGALLSGELKQICAEWVLKFLKDHQAKYKKFEPVARKMIYG